ETTKHSLLPCYDLHCHTHFSDGYLSPQALIERAVNNKVTVLAITDHDTVAALAPAQHYIRQSAAPLVLVDGIELSTNWHNFDIHIVGLQIDPHAPQLQTCIEQQQKNRILRAEKITAKLDRIFHTENMYQQVVNMAETTNITRAHIARYLMEQRLVKDSNAA